VALAHIAVLCDQVVEWLRPSLHGLLVDATVGAGGHAAALLEAAPGSRLLGIDRDPEVLEVARQRLQPYAERFELVHSVFDVLPEIIEQRNLPKPTAIVADLGCSSLQLDTARRGFSFQTDGPLDMRMDREGPTAADLVNELPEDELVKILRQYGEERRARAVARAIDRARRHAPLRTTGELSKIVESVVGWSSGRRIHPATRTFQALRIAVNDELGQLERFLTSAVHSLAPNGRMAVIAFHSLEDRLVKRSFRSLEGRCVCPPELPECGCNPKRELRILTRRAVRPGAAEVDANPRSRSARLRVAERVPVGG
jgi:16S rRNA (cytosine1402-N4)-methyltransferase